MKRAYSYIRFSREHQAQGDSLRRQLQATRDYCQKNDLLLDESLKLKDLGVSAFKGKNAENGSLARFMDACKFKQIAPGSALVVESFDRLSRQSPRKAIRLFTELLDEHRIELHFTMAGKVFKPDHDEGVDLILAVAMAMRANEESETKSKRLQAAWAKKRADAQAGKVLLHTSLPWWLQLEKGEIVSPTERSDVVKEAFELTANGYSSAQIARAFNKKLTPTWRRHTKKWVSARIRDLIRSEAPQGNLLPTYKTKKAGREFRIEGYYPKIVSDELAACARANLKKNIRGNRGKYPTGLRPLNIFKGLLRYQGRWLRYSSHRNGTTDPQTGLKSINGYFECIDEETGKMLYCIASKQLESLILSGLLELKAEDFEPCSTTKSPSKMESLRRKLTLLQCKHENLIAVIESGSTGVAKRLLEIEKEILEISEKITIETDQEHSNRPITNLELSQRKKELKGENIESVIAAIRRLVSRIDVGSDLNQLPLSVKFRGTCIRYLTAGEGFEDITPLNPILRFKPTYVLLSLEGGAQRLIFCYKDGKTGEPRISTARVD